MKYKFPLLILPLTLLLGACDVFVYDEDENSAVGVYYSDNEGSFETDRHLLTGSIEVLDGNDNRFLDNAVVRIDVIGDGRVQDSFVVQTDSQGLVRYEVSTGSFNRPYDTLAFEINRPGYIPLRDSIPISQFDVVRDSGGGQLILYQAGAEIFLVRR
jgi:hypothetical protein